MSTLYFVVEWDYGAYKLNKDVELAIIDAIKSRLIGNALSADDIGKHIENIPISVGNVKTTVSVMLERIDPLMTSVVDKNTSIEIRDNLQAPVSQPSDNSKLNGELNEMVMFQTVFAPDNLSSHYLSTYNSLVGIPKEAILRQCSKHTEAYEHAI
jgi:hypothetical protein